MRDISDLLNPANLVASLDIPAARAAKWCGPMAVACQHFEINTPLRIAAFIAQVGHESGKFRYVKEIWGPMPWQEKYEGRADLGNTEPGDGKRFMGRGLIQITGRANYAQCGSWLGLDLISKPELLEQPEHAAMSAAWYWSSRRLNNLADIGDFRRITKKINGGYNGLEERQMFYDRALDCLNVGHEHGETGGVVENGGALI